MPNTDNHADDACAIRIRIARDLAASYAAVPGVVAVFVGGSVARGWADHWSDIELCVVWSVSPAETQCRDALGAVPISRHRVFADPGAVGALEEEFVAAGVKVDVAHMMAGGIDGAIHDVTAASDPDLAKQALLATLLAAIPLHGHEAIAAWRLRSNRYPDDLARAMVDRHLAFGPHDYLTMLAARDDLLLLSDILCRVVRSVLGVLCGINRLYPPSADFKWALRLAPALPIAPSDLPSRLRHILRGDPIPAAADAQRLIDETLDLVETHLPEIDIAPIRARVSHTRSV